MAQGTARGLARAQAFRSANATPGTVGKLPARSLMSIAWCQAPQVTFRIATQEVEKEDNVMGKNSGARSRVTRAPPLQAPALTARGLARAQAFRSANASLVMIGQLSTRLWMSIAWCQAPQVTFRIAIQEVATTENNVKGNNSGARSRAARAPPLQAPALGPRGLARVQAFRSANASLVMIGQLSTRLWMSIAWCQAPQVTFRIAIQEVATTENNVKGNNSGARSRAARAPPLQA